MKSHQRESKEIKMAQYHKAKGSRSIQEVSQDFWKLKSDGQVVI